MKKEIEFEPALRQVISQTFIDTPAPRKTRYRIIRPDLNTLKNGRYIAGIGDGEIQSIGLGSQAIRSLLSQRYMRRTQQPAVAFVCYMFHSEMEIDNIVRIVEAVRYGMDPSEIMQLLVII